jgi:hypothetical protein
MNIPLLLSLFYLTIRLILSKVGVGLSRLRRDVLALWHPDFHRDRLRRTTELH